MISHIHQDSTIKDAMVELKRTGFGLTCVIGKNNVVQGVISDGDIRKQLLIDNDITKPVYVIMNKDFIFGNENESRETLIKKFDQAVKVLPILNSKGQLIRLVKSLGPVIFKHISYARARAPGRISLAGGGTDFTNYFLENDGCGIAFSLAKYAHATLKLRADGEVHIYSSDFDQRVSYASFDQVGSDRKLPLITTGIKLLKPEFGFDLEVGTDFPPGSGLGGSASILTAVAGVFREMMGKKLSKKQIAEFAFQTERLELGIHGGWQDQYATVFGGFNYLQFTEGENIVLPIRLDDHFISELEERLILCYSGTGHLGSQVQNSNIKNFAKDDKYISLNKELKIIVENMKSAIIDGNFSDFGLLLSRTWELKKLYNPKTTNKKLNDIYAFAMKNGALGGRLLGTGGGGFFVFITDVCKRFELMNKLKNMGHKAEMVKLDNYGLKTWTMK